MGFRFRRSIRLLPGVRVNLGKRGASVSVGVRGAHVTVGRTGTRTTVGLPGTGLSYTHLERPTAHPDPSPEGEAGGSEPRPSAGRGILWILLIVLALVVLGVRAFG